MRKKVVKVFWGWQFEKEEKWLNEMAAKGLALISVGFCHYEFENTVPGDYTIRLELLDHSPCHVESQQYLSFIEDTGAEHIGSMMRWIYLRKKTEMGDFELFSDNASKITHLTRIITLLLMLSILNLYIGGYNLMLYYHWGFTVNLLGIINILLAMFAFFGTWRLIKQRKHMKENAQLFE